MKLYRKGERVRIISSSTYYGLIGTMATVRYDYDYITDEHTTDDGKYCVIIEPDRKEEAKKYYNAPKYGLVVWNTEIELVPPEVITSNTGRKRIRVHY